MVFYAANNGDFPFDALQRTCLFRHAMESLDVGFFKKHQKNNRIYSFCPHFTTKRWLENWFEIFVGGQTAAWRILTRKSLNCKFSQKRRIKWKLILKMYKTSIVGLTICVILLLETSSDWFTLILCILCTIHAQLPQYVSPWNRIYAM